ncbi:MULTISPECIES: AAA family ATPase [Solibacillus]|uniref:ATP-binding protein n=1 Tax=Solibacillus merdavium TaxID=2762218 RepID=A0ABR8XKF9_9BACL|nr:ATP-binding protein [Solibacillus merdavium]MBD8032416.1 ATP-binding protein [Solibacillus merdavium]
MFFIQMSGFPGSGKSTLALEIAKRIDCVIVDHDIVKSALLNSVNESQLDGKLAGKISYNIDFSLVDFYLSQGKNVILDSPCLYDEMIEKGMAIARTNNAKYKYIECYLADFDKINNRLKNRVKKISQITDGQSKDIFYATLKSSKKPANTTCFTVKTDEPLHTYIDDVINYINN